MQDPGCNIPRTPLPRTRVNKPSLLLAHRRECGSHLLREELWLFPSGEVSAPIDLVEVGEVGVAPFGPAARSTPDLAREGGEADRNRDLRRSLAGQIGRAHV